MQNCSVCTRKNLWTSTGNWTNGQREFKCRNCGNIQLEMPPQGLKIPPRILYLDIETAFMEVALYDLKVWGGRVSKDFILEHSFVINWAAAWLDTDYNIKGKIMTGVCTPEEAKKRNDKRILQDIWKLMDESDYIAGHNAAAFDVKKLKWRFMVHQMGFPVESKILDSLKMSRQQTAPPSRGLEFLSMNLGGRKKKKLDMDEWLAIIAKDTDKETRAKLLHKADIYCRGDVREGAHILRLYAKCMEQSGRVLVK